MKYLLVGLISLTSLSSMAADETPEPLFLVISNLESESILLGTQTSYTFTLFNPLSNKTLPARVLCDDTSQNFVTVESLAPKKVVAGYRGRANSETPPGVEVYLSFPAGKCQEFMDQVAAADVSGQEVGFNLVGTEITEVK